MKEYAKEFYKGKKWKKCRSTYIKMRQSVDGGMCERCKRTLGYIVHHKVYITPDNINNPNITLNYNNLEYLCHDCHNKEHMTTTEQRYRFDSEGMPIPP